MKITKSVNDIFLRAFQQAKINKDEFITPEHILYASLFQEEFINGLEACGGDVESLKAKLKEYIDVYISKKEEGEPTESVGFKQLIYRAGLQAQSCGKNIITLDHIINAIYTLEDSYASYYMQEEGINLRDLLFALCHDKEREEKEEDINKTERSGEEND
ncbi:MAG: ATP-dependent Clp protease ATP-binding subunit ClpA, partial [Clostridiales bacterium]|nr:ATP-dependent Clp protease ATP-binding subunit ClpA [Clostridiales bacterium]